MKYCCIVILMSLQLFASDQDSLIVATVGTHAITAGDLTTSYEFGPAFVKRTTDPLREHLKYMVYEYLLALEGEKNGLDETDFVKSRVQGLQEDYAVEELYKQEILSKVTLSKDTVEMDIAAAKKNISLRWIYTDSKRQAVTMYNMISSTGVFDSLFTQQLSASIHPGDRSYETTLLKLERDNQDLAATVKTMHPGTVSKPIQVHDGYYIISFDSLTENPITTQTEYAELRNQAVEIRTKIEADNLADAYIKNVMEQNYPVIKADGFNILRAYLADKGLSHDTKIQWEIPSTFMTEAGPQPISSSEKYLSHILVTYGKRSLQVRDFADWYDIRQFQLDTRSEKAFSSSVRRSIWKMVQDKLLSQQAYARGFDRLKSTRHETELWKRKMLYLGERSALLRTMDLSDSVTRSFYKEHSKSYVDANGTIKKYKDIKNEVKQDCFYSLEPVIILKKIEALKKKYPVVIHDSVLTTLSMKVRQDPHAIDAVFYKPGGTFPHVAFPTIDEAWIRFR